jgi:hypothetical protein
MDERMKRNALIVGAIVLALLSIGAGALIALTSEDDRAQTTSSSPSSTASQTLEPSGSSEPSASQTPKPSGSGSPVLGDGHHFVYVRSASRGDNGKTRVRFDLAYFYQGDRAQREAAERGDEAVNGYYIVNDNPKLRTLTLADDVEIEYIPQSACCELQPWDIDSWFEAIGLSTNPGDYPGTNFPWWFTVEGGRVTRIEQQYLP